MILVCSLIAMVTPIELLAASSDGIFLNNSGAKRLVTDVKYYKTNYPLLEQKYNVCIQQFDTTSKNLGVTNQLLDGCNLDKKALFTTTKEFEQKFIDKNNKLIECEASKPSRFTWFALGGLTTAVITALLVVMVKK
jgi:hypothetical protein